MEQAREVAMATSMVNSYSGDSILNDLNTSSLSSPSNSLGGDAAMPLGGPSANERHHLRHTLRRNTDEESLKGRKRFSKRHSKSGLVSHVSICSRDDCTLIKFVLARLRCSSSTTTEAPDAIWTSASPTAEPAVLDTPHHTYRTAATSSSLRVTT